MAGGTTLWAVNGLVSMLGAGGVPIYAALLALDLEFAVTAGADPGARPPGRTAGTGHDRPTLEREAAITEIFHRHYAQFVRLAVRNGADQEAEDIVDEAFCVLHRRWNKLRDPGAALPYLRSVVCNLARMRVRHMEVVRRHQQEPQPDADSAESVAVVREDRREVAAALRRLPTRQREALVLRYFLGLHEAEVAHAMGISRGAVKAHTSRGIAGLKRALGARW